MKSKHGFTLVEMLVVIVVIAILAGLLFPAFVAIRQRAWDARARDLCLQVAGSWKSLGLDHNRMPPWDIVKANASRPGDSTNVDTLFGGGSFLIEMDNKAASLLNWWNPEKPNGAWNNPADHGAVSYKGMSLVVHGNVKPTDARFERMPEMEEWGVIAPWALKHLKGKSGSATDVDSETGKLARHATVIAIIDGNGSGTVKVPGKYTESGEDEEVRSAAVAFVWSNDKDHPKARIIRSW